jgi:hypothetical protein
VNDTGTGPGAAEDVLAAIREVLIRFDWENGDRQLALEEIDRIAFGQQR